MTMNRHEPFEELISASLHGDLTADERRRLDAHLDTCDQCRGTLAAFAEERRMIAGLRHVAPPRDLGARVRAGIEYASVPWWRRPTTIFTAVGGTLAAVTGALLALVVLNGNPTGPQVADATPTPGLAPASPSATSAPGSTGTPAPTLPPPETPAPGETPAPLPTPGPDATPNPIAQSSPEPDLFVAMTGPADNQTMTLLAPATSEPVVEPADTPLGPPIAAELSPDGGWLALVTEQGLSGTNQVRATRMEEAIQPDDPSATPIPEPDIATAASVVLGESVAGSPFLEHLAWAPDGSALAYTLADPDGSGTDVWIFDRASGEFWQLTDTGDAYAASWVTVPGGGEAETVLWVSRAETVTSYLVAPMTDDGEHAELIDPAVDPIERADNTFQPLVSPNGALAIFWRGVMTQSGNEWLFTESGTPVLAEHRLDDEEDGPFRNQRDLFGDVTIDRDAFTSAAIAWGLDSDSYAVWNAAWTGLPQSSEGEAPYPDLGRVYFGHASDPRGITRLHAIDRAVLPADGSVVDVKVSPTGRHLVVTVRMPTPGDLDAPTARLLLITRSPEGVADEFTELGAEEGQWFGPAVFDAHVEIPDDASGEEPEPSPSEGETP
jgi:hypothetical protein